jgi:membrane fusion protein (multidrug efflux system)
MKKIPSWLIIILVITLLIGSKFLFFSKKEDKPASANKSKNVMPVAVNYYVATFAGFTNDVFATGMIGAFNQIDILPEVSGKVTSVLFKEGETVLKGSTLVKLNDADLQAQLLRSKTQSKLSEQKLERLKKLIAVNGISQEEFDVQENELNSLKADQAIINAQLAKTTISAPFTGVIGLKNISEGSFISSSTPIASLVQVSPLFVEFSVPEKYSSLFKKGLSVKFSSDNTSTTKTIKARAMYTGYQTFYPGSFVKVFVNLDEAKNTLMIPTQAVIPTLKGQKVIVNKNGIATEVMVTIGVRTDEKIQIIDGLNEGDTIITTGLLSVKKDSKLKLLKATN